MWLLKKMQHSTDLDDLNTAARQDKMHKGRCGGSHDTPKAARTGVCGRQRLPLHKECIRQAQAVEQHAGERQGSHARHGLHINHVARPAQQHARQHRGQDQRQARPRAVAQQQLRLRRKHDAHGGAERRKCCPNRAGVGLPHLRRGASESCCKLRAATSRASLLRGTVRTLYAAAGVAPRFARLLLRAASDASNACALAALPLECAARGRQRALFARA